MYSEDNPRLIFLGGIDERDAYEAFSRGYRCHVWAELPNADCCPLVFYDPERLEQVLEVEARSGNAFIGEPGLVVISEVTPECMEAAVLGLYRQGYFDAFKSVKLISDASPARQRKTPPEDHAG